MCELHLPALYEWDHPVGTCPLTFDRRGEAIQHAQRSKHHLSCKECLERYHKGKGKQRAMKSPPFSRPLCFNSEDYKPIVRSGELKQKEADAKDSTSQPPEEKAKATKRKPTLVPAPWPTVNPCSNLS